MANSPRQSAFDKCSSGFAFSKWPIASKHLLQNQGHSPPPASTLPFRANAGWRGSGCSEPSRVRADTQRPLPLPRAPPVGLENSPASSQAGKQASSGPANSLSGCLRRLPRQPAPLCLRQMPPPHHLLPSHTALLLIGGGHWRMRSGECKAASSSKKPAFKRAVPPAFGLSPLLDGAVVKCQIPGTSLK